MEESNNNKSVESSYEDSEIDSACIFADDDVVCEPIGRFNPSPISEVNRDVETKKIIR